MATETTVEVVTSSQSVLGVPIIETVTVLGTVPVGPRGVGLPRGGTTGQVVAKASDDDYDFELVDPTAGSGMVDSVVEGTNVDVDATDPANPVVSVPFSPVRRPLLAALHRSRDAGRARRRDGRSSGC
jgi:hypothetical protein